MTDKEFNAFYNEVGLDAYKYARNHGWIDNKQIDKCIDDFDKKNNLNDASSFLE